MEEQKVPTREEVIKYYADQIEIASLITQLADLNAIKLEAEVRKLEATIKLANLQQQLITPSDTKDASE